MVKKTEQLPEEVCQYTLEQEKLRELRELRKLRDIKRRNMRKNGRHLWTNKEQVE